VVSVERLNEAHFNEGENTMTDDRTVHATTIEGGEVVRYDKAGKWYLEYPSAHTPRHALTLEAAVFYATRRGSEIFEMPGGQSFRAAVRRTLEQMRV